MKTRKRGWGKNSVHLRRTRFKGAPSRQTVLDQIRSRMQEEEGSNFLLSEYNSIN